MAEREIVLDTETTGLDPTIGHRVIEIGGVEILNRRLSGRHFHHYLQPDRRIDPEARKVHGISDEFLTDKPRFAAIADEFLGFIRGARLIIHNAPFDLGFLNAELQRWQGESTAVEALCQVLDTLDLARRRHPGQRNSLDALCKRYGVDNSQRDLHGALLDARILADVYLVMTREQGSLGLNSDTARQTVMVGEASPRSRAATRRPTRVIRASEEERVRHERILGKLNSGPAW